jgi:tetratricopeptide (TPR) repeat protein
MTRTMVRPYPGTCPFRRLDNDRFFGRKREANTLAELWRTNSLTIAAGPTGSGKTSLLQAGLLPLVDGGRAEVLPAGRVSYGSTFPAAALPEHNPYTVGLLGSWSPGEPLSHLAGLTIQGFLRQRAERHGGAILAVIDQAEELLADSAPRKTYRRHFLRELNEAVRQEPRLHLLLCIRDSAVEEFSAVLGNGAQCRIGPLSFDGALEAVTGPVRAAGLNFGTDAAEEFVTELITSTVGAAAGSQWSVTDDSVPPVVLQAACVGLWEALPPSRDAITKRDVRQYGDVDAALGSYSSQVIAAVADEYDLPSARVRSWLIQTFVNEHGRRGTAYEGMTDTAGMPNSMARALEDRHLLTSERRSGSRWYELLSERLIQPLRHAANVSVPAGGEAEVLQYAARALSLGDLDLAERYAREALLRTAPAGDLRLQAKTQSLLGNVAHERGKPADAEARYRRAAELFETVQDTAAVARQLAAIGRTLLDQGHLADAVHELRAAADRLPNEAVVQTGLGWALWQLGQSRTAEAIFSGVLARDGSNVEALRGRGEVLAELGDARGALRDLDRLVPVAPPSVRTARGLALAQLGELAQAKEEIKAALIEAPHNGPVLLYAARAEAIGGDKAAAMELAERALIATDPSLPPYQREAAQELIA